MEKLHQKFKNQIFSSLKSELKKNNIFEVPRVEKVVISSGVGAFKENKEIIEKISAELARITGQRPKINLSRKSVSAFKLRTGQPVGLTVTLRRERMNDFLDKLINVALPRVRDFRGISTKSFDGQGNYVIGVKEYPIFPEVKYENIAEVFGLSVIIKTTAKTDADAKVLLQKLGFPFEKK